MQTRFLPSCLRTAALLAAATFVPAALADVSLAPMFRDGAVLQRGKPIPVWGRADAGEKVSVTFHGQSAAATAGADGRWQVVLPPEQASAEPAALDVAGNNAVRIADVVVGDVWLCGGQSNMEFRLVQAMNAKEEIAAADYPLIRQMKIPHEVAAQPADDVAGKWVACSPAAAGDFTAVGYFFARDLYRRLRVPIGILNDNWGGTQIESWMSHDAIQADSAADAIDARWKNVLETYPAKVAAYPAALKTWAAAAAEAKAAGEPFSQRKPVPPEGPGSRWEPAGMYNAMIHPFVPAAIRGFLWYQGEANAGRAAEYRHLFPEMIQQWRRDFGQGDLPFYFVQLADFGPGAQRSKDGWAFQREAQAAALALPGTGMAVTIDIGNPDNIHPTNKQEVGRRLALWARHELFGEKIEYSGPVFEGARREGSSLVVSFSHAAGLEIRGEPASFEVAGEDRRFVPATAKVDGTNVIVTAASVGAPVAVRYAWRNVPQACLYNGSKLPASPFRSDAWQ